MLFVLVRYTVNKASQVASSLLRYRSGNGFFDARVSFVVAGLLGMNPAYVIACANMERAEYQEDEKSVSFWMHYALSENMTDNSAKKNAA